MKLNHVYHIFIGEIEKICDCVYEEYKLNSSFTTSHLPDLSTVMSSKNPPVQHKKNNSRKYQWDT